APQSFLPRNVEAVGVLRARSRNLETVAVGTIANLDERIAPGDVVMTAISEEVTVPRQFSTDLHSEKMGRSPCHRKSRSSFTATWQMCSDTIYSKRFLLFRES